MMTTKKKELARKIVRILLKKLPKTKEVLMSTGDFLGFLSTIYRKDSLVRNFLINPFIPKDKKMEFLKDLMSKFNVPENAKEVFEYMIDINAFSLLSEMKRFYDHEVEKIMRMSKGYLVLAGEVDGAEIEKISQTIQKILGREIEIDVSYDKSLIGGFVFKTSGFIIDASVKRQLEDLIPHGG